MENVNIMWLLNGFITYLDLTHFYDSLSPSLDFALAHIVLLP